MTKLTGKPHERQEQTIKAHKVKRRQAPGRTVEARENQLERLAYDLAEEKFLKKTASSQEILYFLKSGSSRAKIEKLKLEHEAKLAQAKTEALESQKKIEELYEKAIRSMALYQGREVSKRDEDD